MNDTLDDGGRAFPPPLPPQTVQSRPWPAYMRLADDGRLELVLHPTQGQVWNVCQRKHEISYGLRIERAQPKPAQNYGKAIHAALEHRFRETDANLADIEAEQMDLLEQHFETNPQPGDEWRNLGRAQHAIRAYNEAYPTHDWEVLAVEEGPDSDLPADAPHDTDRTVGSFMVERVGEVWLVLRKRKDLIVAQHDGLWIVDHKTASEWGDDPDKNQQLLGDRRSFQFRAYAWDERERQRLCAADLTDDSPRAMLPVRGIIGNYIIGRKNYSDNPAYASRRGSNPKPRDEFVQWKFPFNDAVLDEWCEEALALGAEIVTAWRDQKWRQAFDRSCSHYGRCPFYDYCEASPELRDAELGSSRYQSRDAAAADGAD